MATNRSAWSLPGVLVLASLLSVGACGGSNHGTAHGSDAGSDATTGTSTIACTTDSDCATQVPPTAPADCATGTCDSLQGVCVFSAKDEDGDGFPAANCASSNGVAIVDGEDCNDQDPNLYPGHAESCDTGEDGGAPPPGLCTAEVTCLSNGAESPCTPVLACSNQACASGACVGHCAPGQTECQGNNVQTCDATGEWGAIAPCVSSTCITTDGGSAACEGACAAGTPPACQGNQPEACTGDVWQPSGGPCSGSTPICLAGTCLVCSPDTSNCSGSQPEQCNGSGTAWSPSGPACAAPTPDCMGGKCVPCSPGAFVCNGAQAETCDSSGTWQDGGAAGACQPFTVASSQGSPHGIALDAQNVYWIDTISPASVLECPRTGCAGSPVTLAANQNLASGSEKGDALAVDGTSVYWIGQEGVLKCATTGCGGTPSQLVAEANVSAVAVNETSVYWVDQKNVLSTSLDGGAVITLFSSQTLSPSQTNLAIDQTSLYWCDQSLKSLPLAGGTPTTLVSNVSASFIALDANNVYWGDGATSILACAKSGCGGSPTTIVSAQAKPEGVAADGTNIYWINAGTTGSPAAVMTCTIGACSPSELASGLGDPWDIAVDATGVFWTDTGAGTVTGLTK